MTKQEIFSFQKILVFDTTNRDQTGVTLVTKGRIKKLTAPVRAQDLQKLTDELLKTVKTRIKDIDAIAVLTGPGSYTGTRIGVAGANTLGWLINKPILELVGDSLNDALNQLKNGQPEPVTQARARHDWH